jgi:hypothetical protein
MYSTSMFCFCPPPPHFFLMHFLLANFSFLSVMSFFFSLSLHFCVLFAGSVHGLSLWGAVYLEDCLSVCFFSCLQGWINFISLPDGLRHLLEIIIAHLYFCAVQYMIWRTAMTQTLRMRI